MTKDESSSARLAGESPPPSLLVLVIDTNPYAWSLLSGSLPLSSLVANLVVFLNAHLAMHHSNTVAVLAAHTDSVRWLYPTPSLVQQSPKSHVDSSRTEGASHKKKTVFSAHKYRPFAKVEHALTTNLSRLVDSTTADSIRARTSSQIGGALTTALAYIAKQVMLHSPVSFDPFDTSGRNVSAVAAKSTMPALLQGGSVGTGDAAPVLTARIMVVSVSGDLAGQYVPIMNAMFASQQQKVPIDVLKLFGDTVLLQQVSDATGGVYLCPADLAESKDSNGKEKPPAGTGTGSAPDGADSAIFAGLLQHLMFAFLPDPTVRPALVMPGSADVDFRAVCFCHRKVVDVGVVCSVCLSIFCKPPEKGVCGTCGSAAAAPSGLTVVPAVIPKSDK